MDADINNKLMLHQLHDNFNLTKPAVPESEEKDSPILDSLTELITDIIFFVVLCAVIGVFGIVANVINIIIYYRQGILSCGSNLNLFSLSMVDLGVSIATFLHGIGFGVIVADIQNLSWDPFGVVYLTIGWPENTFLMTNRLLTAYIAFQRCMCVVLPFNVKSMFTIRRSLFFIITLCTYPVLSNIPIYIVHRLVFKVQENTNRSKLVLVYTSDRELVHSVVFQVNNFFVSIFTVVVVFVCTVVTSERIRNSKEWRKSVSRASEDRPRNIHSSLPVRNEVSSGNPKNSEDKKMTDDRIDKETRLVKMITKVSLIYLLCYVWEFLLIVVKAVDDRIRINGPYNRLAKLFYSFTFVSTAVNSSVNIFIYYGMSSRYRNEFRKLFGISQANENVKD